MRELGLAQPQVSKHLRVLREVGSSTSATTDASGSTGSTARAQAHPRLGPGYERMWTERFEQLDDVLDDLKGKEQEMAMISSGRRR